MRARRLTLGAPHLRAAARLIQRATGVRIDIQPGIQPGGRDTVGQPGGLPAGGTPGRRGKQLGIVGCLERRIRPVLPPGLTIVQSAAVEVPRPPAGHRAPHGLVPDLVVCPSGFLDSDESLLHPRAVMWAAVVLPDTGDRGTGPGVRARYAAAGVARLLVIDPSLGTWHSLAGPDGGGGYRHAVSGGYGERISLSGPFRCRVDTSRFPRYGAPPGPA
ncbi:hypothetical protein GCM10009716_43100 [Streptomyces sodiiphilus]|uniref:Restriction endonuclease domain-containing protein n=1 Tax=Streptomyces sodiiphilus TaxID=226217 RepID=A0ABN2PSL1_9ACTN